MTFILSFANHDTEKILSSLIKFDSENINLTKYSQCDLLKWIFVCRLNPKILPQNILILKLDKGT